MKKKLILMLSMLALLVCVLAISINAAEPDNNGKTVTLADGTVCALYDTDGNPLLWYVTSTSEDGTKTYAYVDATSEAVAYINSSNTANQLDNITITVDGTVYAKTAIAVANFPNAKITAISGNGRDARIGEDATRLYKTFQGCSNFEYAYINLATTSVGQESFKSCSNLKFINLEELTELTAIGLQALNGCSILFDEMALDLTNTKLKELGNLAFCTVKFTSVKLPEATFTKIGNEVFRECTKLETVTGTRAAFESITSIGGNSFISCYKLKQIDGLIENGIMIIPEGVTSVGTYAFKNCDAVEYIELPSTLTYIAQQGFSYMGSVKLINFEKITGVLTLNNCGHFRDMDSLVAVSLPEGMIEVNNRAFASCDNLTAFYMPNSIQRLSSNGGGEGSFCDSKKLYFVQESFTVSQCLVNGTVDTSKLVLPEKPEVYFMPTSLETFTGHTYSNDTWSNATIFRNCSSLNNVLVFPESFTSMVTLKAFDAIGTADSPKTIVFRGDIQSFVISHQSRYISFVFANANDKSFDDLGILRTTGNSNEKESYAYFCATGKKYSLAVSGRAGSGTDPSTEENITKITATIDALKATETEGTLHIVNAAATNSTKPSCENGAMVTTYCFCGAKIEEAEDKSTILGHSYTIYLGIVYENYMAEGCKQYACERCDNVNCDEKVAALMVWKGYSHSEFADMNNAFSVVQSYYINKEAIATYEAEANITLSFGCIASGNANGTAIKPAIGDNLVLAIDLTNSIHDYFDIKISGITNEKLDTKIVFCAYIIEDDTMYYLDGDATKTDVTGVSFNEVVEIKKAENAQ